MSTRSTVGTLPSVVDLLVYQGDDLYMTVTVSDPDTGEPVDLTGMTAKAQIRRTPDDAEVLAELTPTMGASSVDLHLDATDAATLTGTAAWDLQLTDAAGVITTIAFGSVKVTAEVTR